MSAMDSDRNLVLQFVRGERKWRDLGQVGLTISFMDDGCNCDGSGTVVVAPAVGDVASGLVRMVEGPEVELRRWASVVLAASAVIDLRALELHSDGERILSTLWDASAGVAVEADLIALGRTLAS